MKRVLKKKNGILFLRLWYGNGKYVVKDTYDTMERVHNLRTIKQWKELVKEIGFTLLKSYTDFVPYRNRNALCIIAKKTEKTPEIRF